MANSYNGWAASPNPSEISINQGFSVDGMKFPGGIKSGDVEIVFRNLIPDLVKIDPPKSKEFNVEGFWGYSYRANVNNPSSLSCHASGTAIDYRAVAHPNQKGSRYLGWSQDQIAKVHALLSGKYRGLVNWLAYDSMHFEIRGSATQIKTLAMALSQGIPKPEEPDGGEDDMPLNDEDKQWIKETVKTVVDERIKAHLGESAVTNPNAALNIGVMARINATDNKKFKGVTGYTAVT